MENDQITVPQEQEQEVENTLRRMPEHIRRHMIRVQGGKFYLPAAYRIVWFRDSLGDSWRIETEIVEGGYADGYAVVRARVLDPAGIVVSSGHKMETKTGFPAGWIEKAESGAVARALAMLGFGTQFLPELDEGKVADSPVGGNGEMAPPPGEPSPYKQVIGQYWQGPGQCPRCGAPEGKKHGSKCQSVV